MLTQGVTFLGSLAAAAMFLGGDPKPPAEGNNQSFWILEGGDEEQADAYYYVEGDDAGNTWVIQEGDPVDSSMAYDEGGDMPLWENDDANDWLMWDDDAHIDPKNNMFFGPRERDVQRWQPVERGRYRVNSKGDYFFELPRDRSARNRWAYRTRKNSNEFLFPQPDDRAGNRYYYVKPKADGDVSARSGYERARRHYLQERDYARNPVRHALEMMRELRREMEDLENLVQKLHQEMEDGSI